MSSYDSPPSRVALQGVAKYDRKPQSAHALRLLVPILSALAMFASAASLSAAPTVFDSDLTTSQESSYDEGGSELQPSIGADDFEVVKTETIELPASGQFIVDFAMQYYGYPYVWAGNGPGGFDCSGFTQYVILNTIGIDIGHDVAVQTNSGYWVDWGNWLPGDLVFFAGTYRAGISHVGIYIGDGQFIHAENEGTGVTISSVWSDYYAGHYYGAFRLV